MVNIDKIRKILTGVGLCAFGTIIFCNWAFGKNSHKSGTIRIEKSAHCKNLGSKSGKNIKNKTSGTGSKTQSRKRDTNKLYAQAKININTAEVSEISDHLKGIGGTKAKNIVDYRRKYGNFSSIDEIKNVKGIGEKTFENIKNFITI